MNKKQVFKLHSWLGLISGLFILFFALSGAVILWHKQMHQALNSRQLSVEPAGKMLSYDSLHYCIQQQLPDYDFNGFPQVQSKPNEALAISVDQYDKYQTLYINPYSGKVIGKASNSLTEWIYKFHYSFQLGLMGEWLAFLFSLTLIGSVITGLIVYRKSIIPALLFEIKINFKNWRVASSGLHRVLGVWAMLFNLTMAITGLYLMLYLFVPDDKLQPSLKLNNPEVNISIDESVARALNTFPDLTINYIKLPRGVEDSTLSIWGNVKGGWNLGEFATNVDVNIYSGLIVDATSENRLDALTKIQLTLSTLHFGHYGGLIGEIVYLIFALLTAIISITGFLLYWRRQK